MVAGSGGSEEETALSAITMQPAYIYDDVLRCAAQFTGKERDGGFE